MPPTTAVGTSISDCAAVALETYISPSLFSHRATYSIGASAINSGLTVLAALALPGEKSGVCLGQAVDLQFANWLLAAMAITSDVAVKHFTEQGQRQKGVPWIPQIGHSAPFGGAAFAAVYHYLALRRYRFCGDDTGAIEDAASETVEGEEKELLVEGLGQMQRMIWRHDEDLKRCEASICEKTNPKQRAKGRKHRRVRPVAPRNSHTEDLNGTRPETRPFEKHYFHLASSTARSFDSRRLTLKIGT